MICLAAVTGIAIVAILAHSHRQERSRVDVQEVADAIQQFSTGSGWSSPPPIEAVHSNIVIDGGTIEIENEVIVHQPTPWDLREAEQRRIRNMALIDDRPKEGTTEQ